MPDCIVVPIREFTDAAGVRWRVWSTMPFTTGVAGSMQRGWLTFESGELRRRLVPIPPNWENAADAELCRFCAAAEATSANRRTGSTPVVPRDL